MDRIIRTFGRVTKSNGMKITEWTLAEAKLCFAEFLSHCLADRRRRTDTPAPVHRIFRRCLIFVLLMASAARAATFYVSPAGDDLRAGTSPTDAWQSIAKVNSTIFNAGDSILFEGGRSFTGRIYLDAADTGSAENPITVSSYGIGRATIDGAAGNTFYAYNTAGINISNLIFVGAGASSSTGVGLIFYCDLNGDVKIPHIYIDNVDVSGFQFGIRIGGKKGTSGYDDVRLTNSKIHDNQCDGVRTSGYAHFALTNFYVAYCEFYNNFGDPLLTTNNGSGLVLGQIDGAIIERCLAHDNGALCTAEEGGSGFWCHDSTNVVIQSNESWNNRTSGINDGGGFDLDGGTTHSILQYNYSHDNDGAGFGLYQYHDAGEWSKNIIRYNISQNDGRKNGFAGIQVANKSSAISDCEIYNNTIFMSPASSGESRAVWFINGTTNFHLRNNLFVTTDGLPVVDVTGKQSGWEFQGNAYCSTSAPLRIVWNGLIYSDLASWRAYTGQESMNADQLGRAIDPLLTLPGGAGTSGNADVLESISAYVLQDSSPLIDSGMNLQALFEIDPGPRDFFGNALPQNAGFDVGACEFTGTPSASHASPSNVQGLIVTAFRASAAANAPGKLSFTATLGNLPANFEIIGQLFIADVAGASGTFTFDARGRALSPEGSARLKLSHKKSKSGAQQTGAPRISINLTGDWWNNWMQRGLISQSDSWDRVDVPVSFLFGNRVYAAVLDVKRTSKSGKCKLLK